MESSQRRKGEAERTKSIPNRKWHVQEPWRDTELVFEKLKESQWDWRVGRKESRRNCETGEAHGKRVLINTRAHQLQEDVWLLFEIRWEVVKELFLWILCGRLNAQKEGIEAGKVDSRLLQCRWEMMVVQTMVAAVEMEVYGVETCLPAFTYGQRNTRMLRQVRHRVWSLWVSSTSQTWGCLLWPLQVGASVPSSALMIPRGI